MIFRGKSIKKLQNNEYNMISFLCNIKTEQTLNMLLKLHEHWEDNTFFNIASLWLERQAAFMYVFFYLSVCILLLCVNFLYMKDINSWILLNINLFNRFWKL